MLLLFCIKKYGCHAITMYVNILNIQFPNGNYYNFIIFHKDKFSVASQIRLTAHDLIY